MTDLSDRPTNGPGEAAPPAPSAALAPDAIDFRPPRQERSRRTLERIVEAARELVAEEGPEALTVQEVVDRAGSSVGSFYARFGAREDLLRYLEERVWSEAGDRWAEGLSEGEPEGEGLTETLTRAIRLLVGLHRDRLAVGRSLAGAVSAPSPRTGPGPEATFHARAIARLAASLRACGDEAAVRVTEERVAIGYRLVTGGIRELDGFLGEETLVRELARVWRCHLGLSGEGPTGPPEDADFFDPWG